MRSTRRLAVVSAAMTALSAVAAAAALGGAPTPIVVRVDRQGFDWLEAGVGAIAGVGLSVVVLGCAGLLRLRSAASSIGTKGERS